MQAINPIKMFFGQDSDNLLNKYLRSVILWRKKGYNRIPVFSKSGVLGDPSTLFKVGEALGNLIPQTSDAVCLLANSGIPIGVVAALSKSLPIYFFHRAGWQRDGSLQFIMPQPPPALEMSILDSHVKFGFTSRACYLDLTEHFGTKIGSICAPILFEPLFMSKCPTEYKFLGDYDSVTSIINSIIGEPNYETENRLLNMENEFWSSPTAEHPDSNDFRARSPMQKWRLFWRPGDYPNSKLLSVRTQELINRRIKSTDTGIWDFFQYSNELQEICIITGKEIALEEYDYIVGIQALGLALAVALTYFNKDTFRGKLVHWLGQQGFLPEVPHWKNKKVLIVTVRLQFGTYLADVVSEIQRLGGTVHHALIAVPDFHTKSQFNRLRQNSLANLARAGVQFLRLS